MNFNFNFHCNRSGFFGSEVANGAGASGTFRPFSGWAGSCVIKLEERRFRYSAASR